MKRTARRFTLLLGGFLALPSAGVSQTGDALERRIVESGGERVAFRFAVEDEVTVCESGFRRGEVDDGSYGGSGTRSRRSCPGGPLEVVVLHGPGGVRGIDMGPAGDHPYDVDLGLVDAREASAWLLTLHARGASDEVAEEGLVGAVVARGAEPAGRLLELAKHRGVPVVLRRSALFWVSDEAARDIDPTLVGIAGDAAEDQEVRDAAIFALSRRPSDPSVSALMELARTAPHVQTRRSALFWLSQSDDERVPDFFAELIRGNGGRS